jgi:hypothetical protein
MIGGISQLIKIDSLLAKLETARFNTLLPVNVEVIKKELPKPNQKNTQISKYLLKVGTKELSTQSNIELEVGKKYWGMMGEEAKSKKTSLSKLLQKPQFLQNRSLQKLPVFEQKAIVQLLSKDQPKTEFKSMLLEKLSLSSSKSEFMALSNMISAINENVFTFIMQSDQKSTLFQLKKRKRNNKDENEEDGGMDFYAAFEHIGPIEGKVEVISGVKKLSLYIYYENSLRFLQNELNNLDFEGNLYQKKSTIEPLFEYSNSLLDIKG